VGGQLHALTTLPLGKVPWYPLDRTHWAPEPVWIWQQREDIPTPTGNWTPRCPVHGLVIILTELSWFLTWCGLILKPQ